MANMGSALRQGQGEGLLMRWWNKLPDFKTYGLRAQSCLLELGAVALSSNVSRKGVVCFVVTDKKEEIDSRGHEFWKLAVITAGVTFLWIAPTNRIIVRDGLHKSVDKQPTCSIKAWHWR